MSQTRMAILKDTSLCVACFACRVACQNQNSLSAERSYLSLEFLEKGSFPNVENHLARKSCMHCGDAPCETICPVGAISTSPQGFVDIDNYTCIGCGICVNTCPYDIPEIRLATIYKCSGCASYVSAGNEPVCVDTCIANSLEYGPREELIAKAQARVEQLKEKYPEANLYGVDQQGGLGLLMILRVHPSEFGLSGTRVLL